MTECSENSLSRLKAHFSTASGGAVCRGLVNHRWWFAAAAPRPIADRLAAARSWLLSPTTGKPERIEHRLEEMLAQRIYGLALGYEDLNDHEQLRQDPLLECWLGREIWGSRWPARAR